MALLTFDLYAQSLDRRTPVTAIIPDNALITGEKLKTLYLLHGYSDNNNTWIIRTRIEMLANRFNLAVIMPSGENKYYVDNHLTRDFFGEYVGKELVDLTRNLLPLSPKREDTFIAGLSMGGYGATRNGLKYAETFSGVASLSAAFIVSDILNKKMVYDTDETIDRKYYEQILGNADELQQSDNNYYKLINDIIKQGGEMPKLYVACGTEDFLINQNREYVEFLKNKSVNFRYDEDKGEHTWDYWDTHIEYAIEYLLGE